MAEAARERPGSMAAILGLEDEAVETLCRKILGVWPANYNCPGQIVISGENDAVEECCAEAESLGARRAIKLKVSGAFHSPLVGNAGKRLKPAIDLVRFHDPIAPFMSTVTAKIEPAHAARLAARRSAHRAGPVHPGRARARARRRHDLRRGRAGQRALRASSSASTRACARSPSTTSPAWRRPGRPSHRERVLLAGREDRARHGCLAWDRPGHRGRARRGGRRRSSSATAAARTRPRRSRARSAVAPCRPTSPMPRRRSALVEAAGDLDILVNNAGLTRDGLLARMSDDDWRTVIDTNLSSVFYTCRAVTRPMMKKRAGAIVNVVVDRRRPRQLGPDELRRVEGGDHRVHEVAREGARQPQRARERRRARLRARPS